MEIMKEGSEGPMAVELDYKEPLLDTQEDPELLMRQYKETGSVELRNRLVMHYSYIAKSVAVKMSSTYHMSWLPSSSIRIVTVSNRLQSLSQ